MAARLSGGLTMNKERGRVEMQKSENSYAQVIRFVYFNWCTVPQTTVYKQVYEFATLNCCRNDVIVTACTV